MHLENDLVNDLLAEAQSSVGDIVDPYARASEELLALIDKITEWRKNG